MLRWRDGARHAGQFRPVRFPQAILFERNLFIVSKDVPMLHFMLRFSSIRCDQCNFRFLVSEAVRDGQRMAKHLAIWSTRTVREDPGVLRHVQLLRPKRCSFVWTVVMTLGRMLSLQKATPERDSNLPLIFSSFPWRKFLQTLKVISRRDEISDYFDVLVTNEDVQCHLNHHKSLLDSSLTEFLSSSETQHTFWAFNWSFVSSLGIVSFIV